MLTGSVYVKDTKEPIHAAILGIRSLPSDSFQIYGTHRPGLFSIKLTPGTYQLRAVELGYRAVETAFIKAVAGDSLHIELYLPMDTTKLK